MRMVGSQLCPRSSICGSCSFTDVSTSIFRTRNLPHNRFPLRLLRVSVSPSRSRSAVIACKYSRGSFSPKSHHDHGDDYFEASVLISESVKHYHLLKQGFREEVNSAFSRHFLPTSRAEDFGTDMSSLGLEFFRRFQSPTIFLKISCNGDFLLPIVVGDFAVEKLLDSLHEDNNEDCSNQFQFVRNFTSQLGHQVKMVKITDRIANTYYARIYFSKVEEGGNFSIDARPSDAINVAIRCKAPIYVNKQVFLTDAIRISYRAGQMRHAKSCYDVVLDSASEGPDLLNEELVALKKMSQAVSEERYTDAATLRDELIRIRNSG